MCRMTRFLADASGIQSLEVLATRSTVEAARRVRNSQPINLGEKSLEAKTPWYFQHARQRAPVVVKATVSTSRLTATVQSTLSLFLSLSLLQSLRQSSQTTTP